METVGNVSIAIAPWVGSSGTCEDETEALLSCINDIRRLFYPKTDYTTTVEWLDVCCVDGCFYLPGRYEVVRAVMICGNPVTLQNEWYQLTHPSGGTLPEAPFAEDRGNPNCKFREYTKAPYRIRAYSESNADEGKILQFSARTPNGREKKVQLTLKTAFEYVETDELFVTYRDITKPATVGGVRVFAVDDTHSLVQLLAIHQPWEINPTYKKYFVPTCRVVSVRIKAKLKYLPLTGQLDLVEYPIDAMIHGAMAITHRRQREMDDYTKELGLAFSEIEMDMAGKETQGSTPLRMRLGARTDNIIQYGFGRGGAARR